MGIHLQKEICPSTSRAERRSHVGSGIVVASFFASSSSLSTATEFAHSKDSTLISSHSIAGHDAAKGRSLRTVGTEDEDESSELRGLWTHLKVMWWADWGVSEDYVRKALKLKGRKGEALTTHKNYEELEYFIRKSDEFKVNKWARNEYTTYQAWNEIGLGKTITTARDLDKIRNTREFKMYKDYVNYFDNDVLRMMRAWHDPPRLMISRGASEAEMTARVEILAEAGRPARYAKLALGLSKYTDGKLVLLNGPELKAMADFKYFQLFLKLRKPALDEELKRLTALSKLIQTRSDQAE